MIASSSPAAVQRRSSPGRRKGVKAYRLLGSLALLGFAAAVLPQSAPTPSAPSSTLMETGQLSRNGRQIPYTIRHLPVDSFPELPAAVAQALNLRGCAIPQTYEAHRPENVIHGSFEHPGSSDWAVLCAARGSVSLLVFFAGAPSPAVLASAAEASRLQAYDATGQLGFNWGIDAATPSQVRDAQAGMTHRSAPQNHDCVADSVVDREPAFHCFHDGAWATLETR